MGVRVIVIGAGVVGSSLAFRLAQGGAAVTLVDRAGPAAGTTGSSFAWTNSNTKTPEDYFALNVAGMQAHLRLRDELGAAPWFREGGNLVWVLAEEDAAELEGRVARLRAWNYPAEWLDRDGIGRLAPDIVVEPEVEHAASFPSESWVDGPLMAGELVRLAEQHGAESRFASEVSGLTRDGARVSGVELANGERIAADVVVNCAGHAADRIARLAGRTLPLAPTLGLIVRVSGVSGAVPCVIHAPRVHLRPEGELVMLHHHDADAALERGEPGHSWAHELLARAREYVPALAEARLSRWSVGIRPIPADERTCAGLLPAIPGYAEVVTHSGITLGPLLGELVAREILSGEQSELLANFRPERFG